MNTFFFNPKLKRVRTHLQSSGAGPGWGGATGSAGIGGGKKPPAETTQADETTVSGPTGNTVEAFPLSQLQKPSLHNTAQINILGHFPKCRKSRVSFF